MKHRAFIPVTKKARRGFRGYPVATVACYGPDDRRASKVTIGIVPTEGGGATVLERWSSAEHDVRTDSQVVAEILAFISRHGARTVVVADRIIGCPHEEGIDYPEGQTCPQCPFWVGRDRWSGDRGH